MNVNDPAHLTEELLERLLASDDIETQRLLRLAGVSELYCRQRRSGDDDDYGRTADHARHDARRRPLRRTGAGGRRIRRHRNGEPRWSRAVRAQEDAARRRLWSPHSPNALRRGAARVEATYELPDMFVVIYDYVDGVTLDHYVGERDDDNGDGVCGSDVAISLILRDEKGNFVFWRSEYVRKPAKDESRAFSIDLWSAQVRLL